MKITVVGCGYVGLVSGACFASLGNQVICVDVDAKKVAMLKKGRSPIYEQGLEGLIQDSLRTKRIEFTTDLGSATRRSDVIFIAVGTPPKPNGDADLSYIENVTRVVAKEIKNSYKLIVEKSTVPVQTGLWIKATLARHARKNAPFDVASNPEFLREGSAVSDFLNPDRIIVGTESKKAREIMHDLYRPLKAPILFTDINSAEIIKHASNSFLAAKISFINAISNICEAAKADVEQVAAGMGLDHRIGKEFLSAGIGFGGSCFPKDLSAFIYISNKLGYDFKLLKVVEEINEEQKKIFVKKIRKAAGDLRSKTVAVLGLAFKPNTDDMRCAPSVDIISALKQQGAKIRCYDPHAIPKAKTVLKGVTYCQDSYSCCEGSDFAVILTEWHEFKELDLKRVKTLLKQRLLFDGRNIYEPERMKKLGLRYISIGRASEGR